MQEESVSVRKHGEGDKGKVSISAFIEQIKNELTVN
jgi:threonyl-tRNA synthetase